MSKESEYDIVVIGGGATGCGVAVDAASRGKFSMIFFFLQSFILFHRSQSCFSRKV
jgi:succinate dehydrogenase/fumarate reductase flavoprotein subunit